jgi:hypothetical protein
VTYQRRRIGAIGVVGGGGRHHAAAFRRQEPGEEPGTKNHGRWLGADRSNLWEPKNQSRDLAGVVIAGRLLDGFLRPPRVPIHHPSSWLLPVTSRLLPLPARFVEHMHMGQYRCPYPWHHMIHYTSTNTNPLRTVQAVVYYLSTY